MEFVDFFMERLLSYVHWFRMILMLKGFLVIIVTNFKLIKFFVKYHIKSKILKTAKRYQGIRSHICKISLSCHVRDPIILYKRCLKKFLLNFPLHHPIKFFLNPISFSIASHIYRFIYCQFKLLMTFLKHRKK